MPSNIQHIGATNIAIPKGFHNIDCYCDSKVKENDQVAFVSITNLAKKEFTVTWLKVDATEIGKERKYAGGIVIRKN